MIRQALLGINRIVWKCTNVYHSTENTLQSLVHTWWHVTYHQKFITSNCQAVGHYIDGFNTTHSYTLERTFSPVLNHLAELRHHMPVMYNISNSDQNHMCCLGVKITHIWHPYVSHIWRNVCYEEPSHFLLRFKANWRSHFKYSILGI